MSTRSEQAGQGTSIAEVTDISPQGIWMLVDSEEFFLSYDEFPWFKTAPVNAIFNVQRESPDHLYWPDIDIDLHVASLRDPKAFPLVAKSSA